LRIIIMIASVTARRLQSSGRVSLLARHYSSTPSLAWWNPFTSASGSSSRDGGARVGSSPSGEGKDDARKIRERKDMFVALLATEFRRLSRLDPNMAREKLVDKAFEELEAKNLDEKTIMQMRHELQNALQDQVVKIFQAFGSVDKSLPDPDQDHPQYDKILQEEFQYTLTELENLTIQAPKGASPKEYLTIKRGAIETLLNRRTQSQEEPLKSEVEDGVPKEVSWIDADNFGYHETIDQEMNKQIRHYQTVNMCRAAKLREELGYSVVALSSSIAGAGRGVFVDGYAKAGSILAFQPGLVWTKEHLVNLPIEVEKELEKNDKYQMTLRPDDHLVDSRKSPYTVLTEENSNPLAMGHVVNHPTPSKPHNCKSIMVNFTQGMDLGDMKRYIPNTYARPRTLTIMGSLWDREAVDMHGMCLLATRDVCNEEVFYDYRLMTAHLPTWYHRVTDTDFATPEEAGSEEK
jgi:hypothetical protein